jgi:hypothetical protein
MLHSTKPQGDTREHSDMTRAAKIDTPATSPDTDFHAWALQTAEAIRARRFAGIDWDAVAEEVEDMGRSERRALESRLEVLLAHLIKWRFQPEARSSSWTGTIKEQRRKAQRLLSQNPSLRPRLPEIVADVYGSARAMAERDTGIDESTFPTPCPWSLGEILSESFLPDHG